MDRVHGRQDGGRLDGKDVVKARREEIDFMMKINLFDIVDMDECWRNTGKEPITVRWVDVNKGSKNVPEIRSRLVARDFKPRGERDREDLFAAMPPLEAKRLLFCRAANHRAVVRNGRAEKMKLLFIDVKKAHLNGRVGEHEYVYIELPSEIEGEKRCGRLRRWLYGMRGAASAWEKDFSAKLQEIGFRKGRAAPTVFWNERSCTSCVVHGDDFTFLGFRDELKKIEEYLRLHYEIKVRAMVGEAAVDDKEVSILNRTIRWTSQGLEYEADEKHAKIIKEELDLKEGSKGVDCAALRYEKDEDASPLDKVNASMFRALAARANYLAQDRYDIQFAAKEACREMASPTRRAWRRLKRIGRYLVEFPTAVWRYRHEVGDEDAVLDVFCDSDWAGCLRSRKSTSSGLVLLNGGLIKSWGSTQATVALSSGEAEYYSAVKAAAEALAIQAVARELGWEVKIRMHVDSSAAKAIASRIGLGKIRHLEVKYLWLQEVVKDRRLEIKKVHGQSNPADIGTKPLGSKVVRELLRGYCDIKGASNDKVAGDGGHWGHSGFYA